MPPRKVARKSAASGTRKTVRAAHTKVRKSQIEIVPMSDALWRVVHEVTAARIRHRALLEVLAEGPYSWAAYSNRYDQLLTRDGRALFAQLVLPENDFIEAFSTWLLDEKARYGYTPSASRRDGTGNGNSKKSRSAK